MSASEFYNIFSGFGRSLREQQDREDQLKYQQDAADLAGKQLDAYLAQPGALGALGQSAQTPTAAGGLSALGATATPRLPTFADASGSGGDYISNLFRRESGGNPSAQASTSSAKGLGQFTDGTWKAVAAAHPDLGLTPDGRTDPNQMLRATQAFTADNEAILNRAGLPVNDATRYSLHFLGSGGGPKFVAGAINNPDAPAVAFVQPAQAQANRSIFYDKNGAPKSAGTVLNSFARSFGGSGTQVAQAPVAVPTFGGAPAEAAAPRMAMQMPPMPPQRPADLAALPEAEDGDAPAPVRPVQVASNGPMQLPTGASGLNPAAPQRPAMASPPMQAPGGAGVTMPGQPVAPVAQPGPQAAADPQADMPAPNARPASFQIPPGGAPQGLPQQSVTAPAFVPGQQVSPAIQTGRTQDVPPSIGQPRVSSQQAAYLKAALANPLLRGDAIKTIQGLNAPEKWELKEFNGHVVLTNGRGDYKSAPGFDKPDELQRFSNDRGEFIQNMRTGQQFQTQQASDKNYSDVTDPAERRAAGVPDWYQGTVQRGPDNKIYYPGAGQQGVTPAQKIQTSAEAKLAENEVQNVIDARDAGKHAGTKLQTLAILSDAWKRGGDSIYAGPGAETILKAKQAAKNFGIDLGGVPESEIVQKVGTQLAAQTAKDLTSRPTQFDFATMLNNNPGLMISEAGNRALINIGQQQAKRELQIAALARKYKYGDNWGDTLDEFERTHPIVSPLTGKPLDPNELIDPSFAPPRQPAQGGQGGPQAAQAKPVPADTLNEARDAIRRGAPAARVIERLRSQGYDASGL